MNRYRLSLTDKQVREALDDYVQRVLYPNHTTGGVVYFSHDLMTGEMLVELSKPLPLDDGYPHGAEEYDYEKHEDEEDVEGSPV